MICDAPRPQNRNGNGITIGIEAAVSRGDRAASESVTWMPPAQASTKSAATTVFSYERGWQVDVPPASAQTSGLAHTEVVLAGSQAAPSPRPETQRFARQPSSGSHAPAGSCVRHAPPN